MSEERTCPVWGLPDFDREHWDFDALCDLFGCKVCVATADDFPHWPDGEDRGTEEVDWSTAEIPF